MIRINENIKTGIIKIVAFLILIISCYSLLSFGNAQILKGEESNNHKENNNLKKRALTVLQNKCNGCHRAQNPGKVFTRDNMERLAPKIYKQVFIKKRMSKNGKLTEEERQVLFEWLKTQTSIDD